MLRTHPEDKMVAVIGHEPQVSELASYLLTGDAARMTMAFKKGAVAALSIDPPLRPGTAVLLWSLPPRYLRALA